MRPWLRQKMTEAELCVFGSPIAQVGTKTWPRMVAATDLGVRRLETRKRQHPLYTASDPPLADQAPLRHFGTEKGVWVHEGANADTELCTLLHPSVFDNCGKSPPASLTDFYCQRRLPLSSPTPHPHNNHTARVDDRGSRPRSLWLIHFGRSRQSGVGCTL
jgi:hypothetical protein